MNTFIQDVKTAYNVLFSSKDKGKQLNASPKAPLNSHLPPQTQL